MVAGSGHAGRGERREAISLDDELGASAKMCRRQRDDEREPAVRVALAGEDGAVVHVSLAARPREGCVIADERLRLEMCRHE